MYIEERSEASFAAFGKVQVAQNRQRQRHRDCPQRQFDSRRKGESSEWNVSIHPGKDDAEHQIAICDVSSSSAWTRRGIRNCNRLISPIRFISRDSYTEAYAASKQ